MWDEWSVADECHAEDVNAGEVIYYLDDEGAEGAGEVVSVVVDDDDMVYITVDGDLDMERVELPPFDWNDQIKILVRDYSGVEV